MGVVRGKRGELSRDTLVSVHRFPTPFKPTVLIPKLEHYMLSWCPRLARSGHLIVEFQGFKPVRPGFQSRPY